MNRIWTLFYTFFKIGALSIGGGYAIIPLIQEQVVERAGWVSEKVFTDIITISQMTPGPLAVNTSTFVGLQIAGVPGPSPPPWAACCAAWRSPWSCMRSSAATGGPYMCSRCSAGSRRPRWG